MPQTHRMCRLLVSGQAVKLGCDCSVKSGWGTDLLASFTLESASLGGSRDFPNVGYDVRSGFSAALGTWKLSLRAAKRKHMFSEATCEQRACEPTNSGRTIAISAGPRHKCSQ